MLVGKETSKPLNGERRKEMVTRGVQVKNQQQPASVCRVLALKMCASHHVWFMQCTGHPSSSQRVLAAEVPFWFDLVIVSQKP